MEQTQINPIKFMASANGQRSKKGWSDKLQGAILAIATSALLGNFTYLWKLNALATKLEDHDNQKTLAIDALNGKMNNLQLNVQDIKESVIRIETKQSKN